MFSLDNYERKGGTNRKRRGNKIKVKSNNEKRTAKRKHKIRQNALAIKQLWVPQIRWCVLGPDFFFLIRNGCMPFIRNTPRKRMTWLHANEQDLQSHKAYQIKTKKKSRRSETQECGAGRKEQDAFHPWPEQQ